MSEASAGAAARSPWHDERGHWLPGNPGGPGNPVAREMARMRLRLMSAVSDEVFDEVVQKLVRMSLDGHLGAIKLLLAYRAGKPDQAVRADELAADEMRVAVRAEERAEQCEAFDLPAPAGRPEAEWRRAGPEARRAEPPAGSRPSGPPLGEFLVGLRAAHGAAAAEAAAAAVELALRHVEAAGQWGPMGTVADTSETTAGGAGEVTPGGGAAGGWR